MSSFINDEQLDLVSGGSMIAPGGNYLGIFLMVGDAVIDFGTGFMNGFNAYYKG